MENYWRSKLNSIPLGLYEKAFHKELSWEKRLTLTRVTGFEFLELSIDDSDERIMRLKWSNEKKKEIRDLVDSTGIKIQSLSLSAHRRYPLGSKSEKTRTKALEIFKQAIDLAVELGIRTMLIAGADNYYQDSDQISQDWFLSNLGKGFEWASGSGVILALENWDIQIDTMTKVMEYVRYFNSPWLQAYPDIGNLIYAGADIVTQLEQAKGHIAALHVKDTVPGQLRYVAPGEGKVPFVDAFEKLADIGFQGPVVLELWTEEFPNAVELVEKAGKFIRAQMEEGWSRSYAGHAPQKEI